MWGYRSGEQEFNPVILYEYQKTRKKEHARRGFADVVKDAGIKDPNIRESVDYKSLQFIKNMSRYEEKFAGMEPAGRLEARIHYVLPLADAFLRT